MLPIPGKGSSEWSYAWVPGIAPMIGGAAAAGLFTIYERMKVETNAQLVVLNCCLPFGHILATSYAYCTRHNRLAIELL